MDKPIFTLTVKNTPMGLQPVSLKLGEIGIPCRAVEFNFEANAPGEIVFHISAFRVKLVVEEDK